MTKRFKHLAIMAFMMVMTVAMLAGCGPKKPAPEDAQAYVKAVLDLMCTGDYDHTVDLADIEEGKESEIRDALVDQMITEIGDKENLSDEVVSSFRDLMLAALEKTKYSVGEAVETEDGGYDVTVTIEPLQIFKGINKELEAVLEDKVAAESDKILAMSEEEQTNYVMEIVLELLSKKVAKPKYDPAEEVVVHYGIIGDKTGVYGCTEAEGEKLGSKLFSTSGL
ncbi:MAG: hypothetical protein IJJ03_05480 [Mogibacterium sp.]|nr:hypothetical protein [Mogibacterium sp.]MBQ6501328.1 hypothetical protein [Mogibacterium sp.]